MVTPKMRKDLQSAHLLAQEQNDLDYYKNVLREFEQQRIAKLELKKAKAAKTPKRASKAAESAAADEDEDVEMADAEEGGEAEPAEKKPKSKKRKAEDETTVREHISSSLETKC